VQPLRIRAHLRNGYAAKDPWSPAIDGILAAVAMRRKLGDEYISSAAQPSKLQPIEGLPLEVCRWGDLWWYAASSPIIVGFAGREKKAYHRRFDDQYERHLVDGIRRVMTAAGPYKNTRLHDTRVICRALEWHVIGDEASIRDLLSDVEQIGGRRGIGYGWVTEWQISAGDPRIARGHRPLPVDIQESQDGMVMPWGIVPPGRWRPIECWMPEERHAEA